jgi:hypothetical protein
MANGSRRHRYPFAAVLLAVALAGCHPRYRPVYPSAIGDLESAISQRWEKVETLKLYGEVKLTEEDGEHHGYLEIWYKKSWQLRADFTHDEDPLVGMVFYRGGESWSYFPGQWSIIKVGQQPDPPLQPPHPQYLRKLSGFLRGYAAHMAALLTGHLLDTTRLPYTAIQKAGKSYVLTGEKDPGLEARVAVWRKEPVIEHIEYPKNVLNPSRTATRSGVIALAYDDFELVEGIPFPFVVVASSAEESWSLEFRYRLIEVNPSLNEAVFRKPRWKRPTEMRPKPWEKIP